MASLAILGLSTAIPLIISGVQAAQQSDNDRTLSSDFIRQSREAYKKAKAAGLEHFLPKIVVDPKYFNSASERQAYEQQVIDGLKDIQDAVQTADSSTLTKAARLKQMGFDVDVNTGALGPSATSYGDDIDAMWQRSQMLSGRQVTQDQADNLKGSRFEIPAGYTFRTADDYQRWQSQVQNQGQQVFAGPGGAIYSLTSQASAGLLPKQ